MSEEHQPDQTDEDPTTTDEATTDEPSDGTSDELDPEELEEPAAPAHFSSGEELQDPDAELSGTLGSDSLAIENFRNPLRLN